MTEDEIVQDFLDRHVDEIATHLLYLGVKHALSEADRRKTNWLKPIIIDSIALIDGPKHDYPGMGAKIKALQALAIKHNVALVTARQIATV
jgi:hypothetical protein